jgi:predicted CXXCH cytochrome family protein
VKFRSEISPNFGFRVKSAPANASSHPVIAPGKQATSPSLIPLWATARYMYCTDCHKNDQGPNAGGVGPNGPHGSQFEPLLECALELKDHTPESAAAYALCYKCHSRSSLLDRAFSSIHRKHVAGAQAACTTCHDPHGSLDKPHLINFNRDYVSPNQDGRLDYVAGECFLSCHGTEHR